MNYFKLLKLKEEELELLKKKLERITLEYRKNLQSKLDMLDLCNKERENLSELNKVYEEEQKKDGMVELMIFFLLLSAIILIIIFNLFPHLLLKVILILGLFNFGEIEINLKVIKYITKKYQKYRALNEDVIYQQQLLIEQLEYKEALVKNSYQEILEEKLKLTKIVQDKTRELEELKNNILEAFYPFLVSLEEQDLSSNLKYQEALKRVRKFKIKE